MGTDQCYEIVPLVGFHSLKSIKYPLLGDWVDIWTDKVPSLKGKVSTNGSLLCWSTLQL